MDSLPNIPKAKQGLVEKKKSPPAFLEDSGVHGDSPTPSRPASSLGVMTRSPPATPESTGLIPSPPPGGPGIQSTRPVSSLGTSRRSLEYIRISKNELEKNQQTLTTLRSEAIHMQAQIRALQRCEQDAAMLQGTCGELAVALGCSIEGVAASAIRDILLTRINSILDSYQHTTEQHGQCGQEIERCHAEMAALNVRISSSETQLNQARKDGLQLDSDLKEARMSVEALRQTCAKSGATVESLRKQITEMKKEINGGTKKKTFSEITQLQTDVGRLKKQLNEKEDMVINLEAKLSAVEDERDAVNGRMDDSEAMYGELCTQLALTLELDSTGSFDMDHLLSQVREVIEECEELRLRCETLGTTMKTAELDSKASRETILRLVSDVKKHEKDKDLIDKLTSDVNRQKELLVVSEVERDELQGRVTATKENVISLERELRAKEERLVELCQNLKDSKLASNSNKSLSESIQSKYHVLVHSLGAAVSVNSQDNGVLLEAVGNLVQKCRRQSDELEEGLFLLSNKQSSILSLQETNSKLETKLEMERSKVDNLEEKLTSIELIREGLSKDVKKWQAFCSKVAKAVELDSTTAEMLTTGDFAHDAILMRAEQLVKQENEALLNKQTAMYSLQRKLKACRQKLESRELQMNLLQGKVAGLEQKRKTFSHMESEWDSAHSKMKNMEKELPRLQKKVKEQRDTISQLEIDNSQLTRLRASFNEVESERANLISNGEDLKITIKQQHQELTELRERARERQKNEKEEREQMKAVLEKTHREAERFNDKEQKLSVFRTAVQRLLTNWCTAPSQNGGTPSDYDLIASLEELIASHQRHKDNAKCLVESLRQLEVGFKTSYKDTLTILSSD